MNITKMSVNTDAVIPLIAALPYGVVLDAPDEARIEYDPMAQLTRYAGRDFSTSRYDESAGGIFSSKSDTKKDD